MLIWDFSETDDDPLGRALVAGKRAVELDSDDYMCHTAYGTALRVAGAHDEMRLFESHMRLCQLPEQEEHWREGYRRIGMDV